MPNLYLARLEEWLEFLVGDIEGKSIENSSGSDSDSSWNRENSKISKKSKNDDVSLFK